VTTFRLWTDDEVEKLTETYRDATREEILEALPGRSWDSVRKCATKMGLHRNPSFRCVTGRRWSDHEEQALRDLYPRSKRETVLAALPRRTWGAITHHANQVGVKRDLAFANSQSFNRYTEELKLQSERKVMDFILDYYRQWGSGPMRQEISEGTGVRDITLQKTLARLEQKGMVVFPVIGRRLPVHLSPALRRRLQQRERAAA
jgi:DNA-binding transcriptional ArsR family regulator